MIKVCPVFLVGGSGTRLWPASRKSFPKQFSKLIGEKSLFQQSVLRLVSSKKIQFSSKIILTNSDFRFMVSDQLQEIGLDPGHILIEPESKNTAPAILTACLFAISKDPEAVLLVAPCDHVVADKVAFHKAIASGFNQVTNGKIVTFGIVPTHPETGYGYLQLSQDRIDSSGIRNVDRFVEKPNLEDAERMLSDGNFMWNSGIFLFKAKDMINAFRNIVPEALKQVSDALSKSKKDLGFFRLDPDSWAKLDNVSIDYAIMEKIQNLVVVPYLSKWSDLGGWDSVWLETKNDSNDNAVSENALAIECSNSLLRSESVNQQIVGLGLENIMAIAMPDAVLVAHKEHAQDVKKVVEVLKSNKVGQAEVFPKDHRPWGWFESLAIGNCFQVKRIFVKPGAELSLQSHKYRSEHWIIVEGTAEVTISDDIKIVNEGQSVYVPLGVVHRIKNPGDFPLVLIEVQIGTYLGEDDIIRYEDLYARS